MNKLPTISIVIPTLNAEGPLPECLRRVAVQDYPKNKLEIIVADGGSTDKTVKIARKFGVRVIENKLKTGEAGKAVGVKAAKNEIITLIDSDNYLPSRSWLKEMVLPFNDSEIIGTEPIEYTYRRKDGYITRYCALIGMNDPLCLFLGNYDRWNYLNQNWTQFPVKSEDKGSWLKVTLEKYKVPTIGANGTMIRRSLIAGQVHEYLFDIDQIYALMEKGKNKFAKVNVGIIHVFSGTVSTFIRKQKRRIKDYAYYQQIGGRKYPWSKLNKFGYIKFIVYSALWLPTFGQAVIGYTKKPDPAWFFHPLACWLTLWVYGWGRIGQTLFGVKEMDRDGWKQ